MNVDLVVVGSGEAAQGLVYRMRAAGWSVAAVDSRPFGGTCSLRGCDRRQLPNTAACPRAGRASAPGCPLGAQIPVNSR
jgi:pyruvate/2-oxoglutarate dehydrogenase complex dihydrolipoamide dehydrogenase (E3) component